MSTTVASIQPKAAQVFAADQIDLIRRTVARGATDDELKLFLYDCQRRSIHPLDKLLHFTKRGGRYTPVTSIDLMRSRAADTGELAGSDDAIFQGEGKFPTAATVTVYRLTQGQRFPYTATARWTEYCPSGEASMWQKMPHTMLAKCSEALALRKAFPQELGGLYTTDEMEQAPVEIVKQQAEPKQEPPHDAETGEVLENEIISPSSGGEPANLHRVAWRRYRQVLQVPQNFQHQPTPGERLQASDAGA